MQTVPMTPQAANVANQKTVKEHFKISWKRHLRKDENAISIGFILIVAKSNTIRKIVEMFHTNWKVLERTISQFNCPQLAWILATALTIQTPVKKLPKWNKYRLYCRVFIVS